MKGDSAAILVRPKETHLAEAETILIAVSDRVLADSLRFSLELEGFETAFCDERSALPAARASHAPGCLVLDHDVFARMVQGSGARLFADIGVPVVLMVSLKTQPLLARAEAAGVAEVVEKPLLGGVLSAAIRHAIDQAAVSRAGPY
jgi:FixJ family two-component response regulator